MSQVYSLRARRTIGTLQIAIILLVAITAFVHLSRGISMSSGGRPPGAAGRPPGAAGRPPGAGGGFNIMQVLPLPLPTLFLLNGIGYIVLVAALYLPALAPYQHIVRYLLIAFAAVTILMYLAIVGFRTNPTGWIDKIAEIALIILLFIEGRQALRPPGDALAA